MGGGTTRVGDPSGKDEARKILTDADIVRQQGGNPQGLHQVPDLRRRRADAVMPDNAEWLTEAQLHRLPARGTAGISRSTAC
jgi:tyrosyl-tRNA synthetase